MAHLKRTTPAQQLQMQWSSVPERPIQVPSAVEQELLSALAGLLHSLVGPGSAREVTHESQADA